MANALQALSSTLSTTTNGSRALALRPRLKSTSGCSTCRGRRKKCDEQRPACRSCLRLGLECRWRASIAAPTATERSRAVSSPSTDATPPTAFHAGSTADGTPGVLVSSTRRQSAPTSSLGFDHPAQLRASPTSMLHDVLDKQMYQYVFEKGGQMMKIHKTVQNPPENMFKLGFVVTRQAPSLLFTHLAVGALHLHRSGQGDFSVAVKYYERAMKALRIELARTDVIQPTEMACLTAGTLAFFEMALFLEPDAHKAHLFAYNKLMQLRLHRAPNAWGPLRFTLEFYIYMFSTSSTFHSGQLLHGQALEYIDELLGLLNQGSRPLGTDVSGVPQELIRVVYKLSWLRRKDTSSAPWRAQVSLVMVLLAAWEVSQESSESRSAASQLTATLYHSACSILAHTLLDRDVHASDPRIMSHVAAAVEAVTLFTPDHTPPLNLGWPLVIIGVAAADAVDLQVLRSPLLGLMRVSGLVGFQSALDFISKAWGDGPGSGSYRGLKILFCENLLQTVHV